MPDPGQDTVRTERRICIVLEEASNVSYMKHFPSIPPSYLLPSPRNSFYQEPIKDNRLLSNSTRFSLPFQPTDKWKSIKRPGKNWDYLTDKIEAEWA